MAITESRDSIGCISVFNLILSYLIYYGCITMIYQFIIYNDVNDNINYKIQDEKYFDYNDIFGLTVLIYTIHLIHIGILCKNFSRHFVGINFVIHKLILIYIIYNLNKLENNNCEDREWLSCYKNNTVVLENNNLNEMKKDISFAIICLTVLTVCYGVFSSLYNYKKIYYFYKNIIYETLSVILFYYISSFIYAVIPIIILCIIVGSSSGNNECNCGTSNDVNNIYFGNVYYNNTIQNNERQSKEVHDIESQLQNIDI